jgi:hypothetical protein
MPFVQGFLRVRSGGHPDQGLPEGEGPVDPGYDIGIERPDQGLPPPPPGIWPPPVPAHPIVPIPPGGSTPPPGTIWPSPGHPAHPIAGNPPRPDQGLPTPPAPGQPPRPDQGLPPTGMDPHPSHPIATGTYWCLVYLPGFGWKYVVVDPSLTIDNALPGPQPTPTPHG